MNKFFAILMLFGAGITYHTVNQDNNVVNIHAETMELKESMFKVNSTYVQKNYTLTLDFVNETDEELYPNLECRWEVPGAELEILEDGFSCMFADNRNEQYIYNVIISLNDNQNSLTITKHFKNGSEYIIKENKNNGTNLRSIWLPIAAVICLIIYVFIFRANSPVGSLEVSESRIAVILELRKKYDDIVNSNESNSVKKKKLIKLFKLINYNVKSIRRVLADMNFDNSNVDGSKVVAECDKCLNYMNIKIKSLDLNMIKEFFEILFNNYLKDIAIVNKYTLESQREYLKSTYGI